MNRSLIHFTFPEDQNEDYNRKFNCKELRTALKHCKDTSPGEDGIHYTMMKNMTEDQIEKLLTYFNYLYTTNKFPDAWRTAVVLPFLKPGKISNVTSSYRPIALTSCMCKVMERMVLNRLIKQLDKCSYIKNYQSGFRKHHSTYDPLVRFEAAIQENFKRDEYLIAVFIDLEKA